jgi:hypothetical protein
MIKKLAMIYVVSGLKAPVNDPGFINVMLPTLDNFI